MAMASGVCAFGRCTRRIVYDPTRSEAHSVYCDEHAAIVIARLKTSKIVGLTDESFFWATHRENGIVKSNTIQSKLKRELNYGTIQKKTDPARSGIS